MSMNQVVGVVVVYRSIILAVTGSKHGNSGFILWGFCFLFSILDNRLLFEMTSTLCEWENCVLRRKEVPCLLLNVLIENSI